MHKLKDLMNLTIRELEDVLQKDYNDPVAIKELLLITLLELKKKTLQLEFCSQENKKISKNLDRIKELVKTFNF